jgi:uncharacterized membrane protein YeaQ/YmgE (transglycosylase-associated protein family)
MVGAIIQVLVSGFIIGALARWAVPGPDPMSVWMTILFGVLGSFIGGGIAAAIFGAEQDSGSVFAILIGSILASTLLVIAYRRFVQHRPITGPEAYKRPAKGPGRIGDLFTRPAKRARETGNEDVAAQIRKLSELHDDGVLSDEEFEQKKADLTARL